MNYTLHLTENCNLKCKYYYEKNITNKEISFENIKLLIDNEIKENKESCFITFYGGEPLLKKDLIFSTIDYINSMKSINVGTDGNFYPCIQFIENSDYIIGNCKNGIDFEARKNLIDRAQKEHETFKKCSINKRCNHTCACQNYLTTKDINKLSPLTCEFERIMKQISDELAEKLYKNNSKLFIQKYYNKNYDILKQILDKKII